MQGRHVTGLRGKRSGAHCERKPLVFRADLGGGYAVVSM
jgi:hypothetical protein